MTTQLTVVQEVQGTLEKMRDNLADSLPKHISVDKYLSVAKTALINNPALASLDRGSLLQCFIQAAQEGLLPDNRESAIVPFKGKAKLMPMVLGICKKARNSGEIATIDSAVVRANDQYEAWADEKGSHFRHVKARGDRGEVVLTYAYAITKDGSVFFEEIDEAEMQKIKAMSRAGDSPWNGSFADEMRRKSAIRRLAKYRLPNSSDMNMVFEKDDDIYDTESTEVASEAPKHVSSRLGKIVASQAIVEPAANNIITADEAVGMAAEVFEEPAKPVAKPVVKAKPKTGAPTVTGKIDDIQAKDGVGAKGPWRRHSVKVNGEYYGTFDTKINEQLTDALDAGQEVCIEYVEHVSNGKTLKNIVSVTALKKNEEADLPI